uniref:ShKT domain-containing protein n=1 Tax=Steinernema glaseri TaxID=37863 RepID=A0A1I7YQY6_9BILA
MGDFLRGPVRKEKRRRCRWLIAMLLLLNLSATVAVLLCTLFLKISLAVKGSIPKKTLLLVALAPPRGNFSLPSGVDIADITFAVAISTGKEIQDENSLDGITAEEVEYAVRFLRQILNVQRNVELLRRISNDGEASSMTTERPKPTLPQKPVNADDYVTVVQHTVIYPQSSSTVQKQTTQTTTTVPEIRGKNVIDCSSEKNIEDGHKCSAWSRAGYCRTHAATRLIFCRHECYCANYGA